MGNCWLWTIALTRRYCQACRGCILKAIDIVRMNIASFKGRACTTTQLRELHNTGNLLSILGELVDAGEIVCLGEIATRGKPVAAWREVAINFSTCKAKQQAEEFNDGMIPGWRAAFPAMFKDPKLKGKRSALHKGEL